MSLNGWHRGEHAIHRKLGTDNDYSVANLYRNIDGDLPDDHAQFHSTRLSFLPVATLDIEGRPWGSILSGPEGFVQTPKYSVLRVAAKLWKGDPLLENAEIFAKSGEMLVAGIGIELTTRRRNKFAGRVTRSEKKDDELLLDFTVNQAIGNCPKYIVVRDLIPHATSPFVAHQDLNLGVNARLSDDAIRIITAADTVFLGTYYHATAEDALHFPSHMGMNHRGGRPGFIRVSPEDSRTVVLPDYSGNRLMTSLGNIEATPLASLTFIDFVTGDILYLTGDAENLVGERALQLMPFQKSLTTVYVTGYTIVRNALPFRQRQGIEMSPYSPPIRLLATESRQHLFSTQTSSPTALLSRIELHSPTIATFTWQSSTALHILPGQAVIMNMAPLVGIPAYRHMAPSKPTIVNDDSVRTWTVSAAGRYRAPTNELSLTLREKRGGAVTGPLFTIARKLKEVRPEVLQDATGLELRVAIVGIAGDFVLPSNVEDHNGDLSKPEPVPHKKLLWMAGGIGLTPFLSMLRSLVEQSSSYQWDINFILASAEPHVLVPLVMDAFSPQPNIHLSLDIFTRMSDYVFASSEHDNVVVRVHHRRVPRDWFTRSDMVDLEEREVYLCGSPEFETAAMDALIAGGVSEETVKREGFEY
ncbi:putative PNPOx domain-containing protein [Mycena indigotica]|uniref:Putative PNPOx domain-containing protein n=1 Tax=Mycena indigotica TaxID=2126181 RepID=A0A8H6WGJ9_9AGAR|nr:putative PNPOx domain-containing protein [Mycena indigotica]KAF7315931.1 putative PNPOx domain-containing protein [Mycena indigotica]